MTDQNDKLAADAGLPSKGRREVLGTMALGAAYAAPVLLAGMVPTKAAAASTSSGSSSSSSSSSSTGSAEAL